MNEKYFSLADLHQEVSTQDQSFVDSAADWVKKGIPLALGSGLVSMYNTGVSLGNAFDADLEKIDYGAKVADYDDDLGAYYKEHQKGIDLGGFLATSLVPGTVGIKALKMAQGGIAGTNAAETVGLLKNTQGMFGYLRNVEGKFTEKALDRVRLTVNEIHDTVNSEKFIAMAAGAGEQALQGAAFQTAVLLTMNQSPILSEKDEGYFTSLLHNSHEILTAGLIQGVIGGGLNALSISGKIKKAIYNKDIAEFPSRHYTKIGESDVLRADPGTGIAADFSYWSERKAEFEARKAWTMNERSVGNSSGEGLLTDAEITRYERTLKNQQDELQLRIKEKMTEGGNDADLGKLIWESVNKSPDPAETMSIIASAAKKFDRVGVDNQPNEVGATKVFMSDGPLPGRKAQNIIRYATEKGKVVNAEDSLSAPAPGFVRLYHGGLGEAQNAPTWFSRDRRYAQGYADKSSGKMLYVDVPKDHPIIAQHPDDLAMGVTPNTNFELPAELARNAKPIAGKINAEITDDLISQWQAAGHILYKDAAGDFHVIEGSDYAKRVLPRSSAFKNPSLIVKLKGDVAGQETEHVYPTIGDLGKPTLGKNGELQVDGALWADMPKFYDPLANEPIQSNAAFVKAQLQKIDDLVEMEAGGNRSLVELTVQDGDLPVLEKLAKEGVPEGQIVVYKGEEIQGNLEAVLQEEKILLRQQLVEAGHDFKRISRELNVTEQFAETGSGDGYMLSKIEDHTLPSYVKIDYETSRLPDGFTVRGVASLMARVQLGYQMNHAVVADILGPWYNQLTKTKGTLLNISSVERFNSLLTSTSADYGGFGMVAAQSGKVAASAKQAIQEEVMTSLNSYAHQVRASQDSLLEVNQVVNKIRASGEKTYIFDVPDSADGPVFMPKSIFQKVEKETDPLEKASLISDALEKKIAFQIKDETARDFLLQNHRINNTRVEKWNKLFGAMGSGKTYDPNEFYLPPINTRKYPYVAFVKEKMESGAGNFNGAGVISAPNKEVFEAKLNKMREVYGDRFDFHTVSDVKMFKKIEGEYYEEPFLSDSMPDSALRKEGLLYDFQPRIDAEILNDLNQWHYNQEAKIIDQSIRLHYAQEFAELTAMGKEYKTIAESRFGAASKKAQDTENPYFRYISTALNINDFNRYNSLWGKFNDATEGIFKKTFAVWDVYRDKASAGEIDWIEANRKAASYGFTPPYEKVIPSLVNPTVDNRSIQGTIAKINGGISTLTLGLDFLNSVINVISFPIMALPEVKSILRYAAQNNSGAVGELAAISSVQIPGTQVAMPTPMRLLTQAVKNMMDNKNLQRASYYEEIGAIRTPSNLYLDVVNASRLSPEALSDPVALKTFTEKLHEKVDALAEAGKKITGYNKAEWAVRFLAADMMRQMTDIAGIAASDAPAYINNFVNRVHGNYLASQRPHLFQGVVGQAISLFQTYQFNIMQNMVRYVEQGDKTAALMMLGLQNTIFGMQGNPGFYILNQAIGNANKEHIDITGGMTSLVGRDVSDWVLYGLGSNALQTSIYNRGDLTPRYVTVVPTKVEDIPSVAIPVKAITSFLQATSNIAKGGDVTASLLDGVAHFGANRPIAGLAQLAQGYRTTGKGNLLTAYNDMNGFTIAAKLAGGEELNRAIAIDAYYRNTAYKAHDRALVQSLGEAVKTTMYKGQQPSEEQVVNFMGQYTRAAGTPKGFNQFLGSAFKYSNQSQANTLMSHVNSRAGRLQAEAMGADPTPDFYQNNFDRLNQE